MKENQKSKEYLSGYDCGINGSNTTNCHFSIFSTHEKMKEWERGKKDGESKKPRLREPLTEDPTGDSDMNYSDADPGL